jgi:hypothetical protein
VCGEITNSQASSILQRAIIAADGGLEYNQFRLVKNVNRKVVVEFPLALNSARSLSSMTSQFAKKPSGPIVFLLVPRKLEDEPSDTELAYELPKSGKKSPSSSLSRRTRSKTIVKEEPGLMVGQVSQYCFEVLAC